MKKIFLFASALAGMFLAASCQQENLETQQMPGTVKFTVEAPGAIATKTIADGLNVNEVHYEVYKNVEGVDHALLDPASEPMAKGVVDMANKKADITLDLLQDQEYTVIFWAQVAGAEHYDTSDLRCIELTQNHQVDANDESRAAFFKRFDFSTYEHKDYSITLIRPFAQLNLLTTPESLTPVQQGQTVGYQIDAQTSEVTITGLAASFNTIDGVGNGVDYPFTFNMALTPEEQGQSTLIVNGEEYHYVSMNYMFVPVNGEDGSATVELDYEIVTDKGTITHEIVNVPIRENYRTNVIGNLFTKESKFEIIVDERFETHDQIVVLSADKLQESLDNAIPGDNTIFLGADIVGDVMIHQKQGVNIILSGQNYKYDGTIKIHNGSNYNDATLVVKNVNFTTSTESHNFIMPNDFGVANGVTRRYSNNVTVDNCTFTATGAARHTAVAVQAKATYNLQVLNCTATGVHSLIQAQSCGTDVIVKNVTVVDGKNGIAFKQVNNAVVEEATITAAAYGIRFDGNIDDYALTVKDCNVTAVQPVIVRKMTGKTNTIAFEGTNTLTTDETFQVVLTNGSDDETYSYPTGTYTLTGNEGLNVYPIVNAAAFDAAVANEKLDVIDVIKEIENVGDGFEIARDVIINMNDHVFNAGSNETSLWYALEIKGDHNVEVNDANFTRAGIFAGEGADVVFNSGKINHKPDRTSRYIFCAHDNGTTITIKDGTFTNDRAKNSFFWADGGAVIYVEGGNFGGVASNKKIYTSNGGQVIITGGTFNFDPTAWLAAGYTATKSGSTWTVSKL